MKLIFITILIILFLKIYFYTPFWISNLCYGLIGYVKLNYIAQKNNKTTILKYAFPHNLYDGNRMIAKIKTSTKKGKPFKQKPITVPSYTIIPNKPLKPYSSFTRTCAYTSQLILKNRKSATIAITVSTRPENNIEPGNYLVSATYTIHKNMSFPELCKLHHDSVQKTKKQIRKYKTIHELISTLTQIDYIFTSWRELSSFTRNDGTQLTQIPVDGHYPSEKDIQNIGKQNHIHIKFNYFQPNWSFHVFEKFSDRIYNMSSSEKQERIFK